MSKKGRTASDRKPDAAQEGEIATPRSPRASKESIVAMALEQFGNDYKPTEAQFDKMIALREKAMDYTHEERMKITSQQKVDLFVFGGVVVALVAIILIVAWKAPDQIGLAITGSIAFLTGGAGGYGLGKIKKKEDE